MALRMMVSGVIGALAGAAVLIAATEGARSFATAAHAQSSPTSSGGSAAPPNPNNTATPPISAPNNNGIIAPGNSGIITQGQHGDNYIQKDPRAWGFTPAQEGIFSESLRSANAPGSVTVRLDDLLARGFKNQVVRTIATTPGWKVGDFGDNATNTLHAQGIIIRVPDSSQPPDAAKALMTAFLASGIQPLPIYDSGFGAIQIVIGSPPSQ